MGAAAVDGDQAKHETLLCGFGRTRTARPVRCTDDVHAAERRRRRPVRAAREAGGTTRVRWPRKITHGSVACSGSVRANNVRSTSLPEQLAGTDYRNTHDTHGRNIDWLI